MRRCAPVRHPATLAAFAAALLVVPLTAPAGTLTPVKLRVHGKEVALKTPAVYDGKEVYLPLDALAAFPATYVITRREDTAIVTPATGTSVEIALARPGRELMFPLSMLNKQLHLPVEVRDGVCDLDAPARKASAPREVREIVERGPARNPLRDERVISAPIQTPPAVKITTNALKTAPPPVKPLVKDDAVQTAASVDAHTHAVAQKETPKADTGSKPAERDQVAARPHYEREEGLLDRELQLNLPRPGSQEAVNPSAKPQFGSPAPVSKIEEVTFEGQDSKSAKIHIKTTAKAEVSSRLLRQPTRLSIDFAKTAIDSEQREWMIDHPFASAMHLVQGDEPSSSRLVLDLAQLVGYNVDETPDGVTINLMIPRGVGKSMRGLIVCVDPGHGGSESTGASAWVNGARVYEKNLTFAIARKLQRLLTEAGVDVIMTRNGDYDPGLEARPVIANKNNADMFVSIHIDDCGIPNSASGTTAYYHMDDASSRALAFSMASHIGNVSGLPVRGAWSDRRRFPASGMAVLRGSRVPATLVEVGYINNSKDRAKLMDGDYQQTIARAIFDGIKGYVHGDLPDESGTDTDTK